MGDKILNEFGKTKKETNPNLYPKGFGQMGLGIIPKFFSEPVKEKLGDFPITPAETANANTGFGTEEGYKPAVEPEYRPFSFGAGSVNYKGADYGDLYNQLKRLPSSVAIEEKPLEGLAKWGRVLTNVGRVLQMSDVSRAGQARAELARRAMQLDEENEIKQKQMEQAKAEQILQRKRQNILDQLSIKNQEGDDLYKKAMIEGSNYDRQLRAKIEGAQIDEKRREDEAISKLTEGMGFGKLPANLSRTILQERGKIAGDEKLLEAIGAIDKNLTLSGWQKTINEGKVNDYIKNTLLAGLLKNNNQVQPTGTSTVQASTMKPIDAEALKWAKANPKDPRAKAILAKFGY